MDPVTFLTRDAGETYRIVSALAEALNQLLTAVSRSRPAAGHPSPSDRGDDSVWRIDVLQGQSDH